MKIGISTAIFYPHKYTEESIDIVKNIGFDTGEIFLNSFSEYSEEYCKTLREKLDKINFKPVSIHAFGSMFEPFLFDKYDRRRKDVMDIFRTVCKATSILGGKYYTFHGERSSFIQGVKEDFDFTSKIYDELIYTAKENGIELAQENVAWCKSNDLNFIKGLREHCKEDIKFTLDIKQAYKVKVDPIEYIDVMRENIVNFHINDRDDKNICLLPGKGSVKYNIILKELKKYNYNGDCIIEVYNENFNKLDELTKSKQFIEDIITKVNF